MAVGHRAALSKYNVRVTNISAAFRVDLKEQIQQNNSEKNAAFFFFTIIPNENSVCNLLHAATSCFVNLITTIISPQLHPNGERVENGKNSRQICDEPVL